MRYRIPSILFVLLWAILLLSVLANIQGVTHPVLVPNRGNVSSAQMRTMSDWPRIALIVDPAVENSIPTDVDDFERLLEARFFQVTTTTQSWTSVAALRSHLQTLYDSTFGLEGAILLGDLPASLYCIADAPIHLESGYVYDFISDLYLMDLDGQFIDGNGDGSFDIHSDPDGGGPADITPEIWVSRIVPPVPPPSWPTDRMGLLSDYLDNLHSYLDGTYPLTGDGLLFVDNPWRTSAQTYENQMANLFDPSDITRISGIDDTTKSRWLLEAGQSFLYGTVMVHAGLTCHTQCFYEPDEYNKNYLNHTELRQYSINIPVLDLFTCNSANFTHPDYDAGWYLFGPGRVASAVSCTRSGGMLYKTEYFTQLARGWDTGRAFLEWFTLAVAGSLPYSNEYWWRGMELLGDPTIVLDQGLAVSQPNLGPTTEGVKVWGVTVEHPTQGFLTEANRSDFQLLDADTHLFTGLWGRLNYTNNGWEATIPWDTFSSFGGGSYVAVCRFETDDDYAGTSQVSGAYTWPPYFFFDTYWPEYVIIIGGGVLCIAVLIIVMYVKRHTLFPETEIEQTH